MNALPQDWSALCVLALLLGMRHGLDADHLAAIDGFTRIGSRQRAPHARYCGALFSLGHGVVVLAVAALAGTLGAKWVPPSWFEALGSAISIGFLLLLGLANLHAVLKAPAGAPVAMVGVRGRLLGRLMARVVGRPGEARGVAAVMGAGALFALSFDTLSQSALFAVMAVQYGGLAQALTLGLLFVLGMLVADGANGWWISHLIARTDRLALVASRMMTMTVACVSLLVAAIGLARLFSDGFAGWAEDKGLALGFTVLALVALSYLMAVRAVPRAVAVSSAESAPQAGA